MYDAGEFCSQRIKKWSVFACHFWCIAFITQRARLKSTDVALRAAETSVKTANDTAHSFCCIFIPFHHFICSILFHFILGFFCWRSSVCKVWRISCLKKFSIEIVLLYSSILHCPSIVLNTCAFEDWIIGWNWQILHWADLTTLKNFGQNWLNLFIRSVIWVSNLSHQFLINYPDLVFLLDRCRHRLSGQMPTRVYLTRNILDFKVIPLCNRNPQPSSSITWILVSEISKKEVSVLYITGCGPWK